MSFQSWLNNQNHASEGRHYVARVIEAKTDSEGRIWHKVRRHDFGPEVKDKDLPFILMEFPGNHPATTTSPGGFTPGQYVVIRVNTGQGGTGEGIIVGAYVPKQGENIKDGEQTKYSDEEEERRRQPNLTQGTNNGVSVTKMVEKGPFILSLLEGIASSGTLPMLHGTPIPKLTDIFSALAATAAIPTASMLSSLPGSIMNVANLLSKFTDKQKKDLKEKMPEETYAYFNAIMNNIQGYEMSNTTSGLRIDETIFTQNAFDFLIEAKTKEDILNFFDKIKTDSVFNGSSKIEDFVVNVGGIFGNQNLTIKNDGSFDLNIDETITKSLSSFTSSLPSSLSGAIPNFSTILQSMDPSIANGIKDVIGIVTAFTNSRKEA